MSKWERDTNGLHVSWQVTPYTADMLVGCRVQCQAVYAAHSLATFHEFRNVSWVDSHLSGYNTMIVLCWNYFIFTLTVPVSMQWNVLSDQVNLSPMDNAKMLSPSVALSLWHVIIWRRWAIAHPELLFHSCKVKQSIAAVNVLGICLNLHYWGHLNNIKHTCLNSFRNCNSLTMHFMKAWSNETCPCCVS